MEPPSLVSSSEQATHEHAAHQPRGAPPQPGLQPGRRGRTADEDDLHRRRTASTPTARSSAHRRGAGQPGIPQPSHHPRERRGKPGQHRALDHRRGRRPRIRRRLRRHPGGMEPQPTHRRPSRSTSSPAWPPGCSSRSTLPPPFDAPGAGYSPGAQDRGSALGAEFAWADRGWLAGCDRRPWLLALLLVAILSVVRFFAVSRFLRANAWDNHDPRAPGAERRAMRFPGPATGPGRHARGGYPGSAQKVARRRPPRWPPPPE